MILADRGIAMSSDELAVFKDAPKELPYLNVHRFLVGLGVAVPEVYVDAAERGVLLLEDIGDTALWDAVQQQPDEAVRRLYRTRHRSAADHPSRRDAPSGRRVPCLPAGVR